MWDILRPAMNEQLDSQRRSLMSVRQATFYFALVYFSQGVCQLVTLMNQPLRMYLEKSAGFDAQRIANFLFIANLPWVIKPLYGLLSDFFPIFGYRRKSYLLLLNLLAALSFLLVARVNSLNAVLVMLTLTGIGVAASDVVVDAMMVQTGQETGRTRLFQSAQWFSLNLAAIFASLAGSRICARWESDPSSALRAAALIAMCVPMVVATLTWWMVRDQHASINLPELKSTSKALQGALGNLKLWLVVAFLFLINFNPGVQTPLYAHLEHVGLPHSILAMMDMLFSVGNVAGALFFMTAMSGRLSTRATTIIGLIAGAAGMLPMLAITGKTSAGVAYSTWGFTYMIVNLSQLTVAAEACPRRVEAVVFAALMSICNLSYSYSDVLGSTLYEGRFAHHIAPLVLISAALTAAGLVFVPFMRAKSAAQE